MTVWNGSAFADGVWVVSGVFSIPLEACSSPSPEAGPRGTPRGFALREYIGSDENRLVQFAVQSLLSGDRRYNPVVFCGPTGTGKTLLAEGLAERWRQRATVVSWLRRPVARTSLEVMPTRSTRTVCRTFATRFSSAHLFVLDDLQQMRQKPAAQEELARLVDLFVDRGTAVLVTSSQPPCVHDGLAAGTVQPTVERPVGSAVGARYSGTPRALASDRGHCMPCPCLTRRSTCWLPARRAPSRID